MTRNLLMLTLFIIHFSSRGLANEHKFSVGAEFDLGLFSQSGNGTKDSQSNVGLKQQKMDIFFKFTAEKTKAVIQMDVLNIGMTVDSQINTDSEGNTSGVSSTGKVSAFDDAWVQYEFSPYLLVKGGYEWAHNNYYGLHSWFYFGSHLDLSHGTPKIELSGSHNQLIHYSLQLWEDVAADQSNEDQDKLDNMSLMVHYKSAMAEAGAIYKLNKGYKISETEVKDKTGMQIFAKYKFSVADLWLRYTQKEINSDQEGGSAIAFGGMYKVNPALGIHLGLDQVTTIVEKSSTSDTETGLVTDVKIDYAMNAHLKYFFQFLSFAEHSYNNNAEKYNNVALGLQGRW